ncbi:MAG: carboxypeptidase-like regulatory domain-containing protein, partial [Muribaculaceae bacterium]|nr:carboxypeptidase-like regulatory domain-containing protein [Muribaculaceae bacterium]
YGAWGTKDHRWKYGGEPEYSFNEKKRHSREFPVHSIRLNSSYDVYRPGQDYIFTNPDNVFLSLHRPGTDPLIYRRANSLTYTMETDFNFTVKASVNNERFTPSRLMSFTRPDGAPIPDIDKTYANIELRYAPGEKFYQTASDRIPINLDAPTLTVSQRYGSGIDTTSVSFMKRFWFSAFGYLDAIVKGGHVWSRATPLFYLTAANTNMSYTIQPESFALTAPMEFVADSHCSFFFSYWFNGNILNRIPLVKKLKLREVVSLHGFYGHLSDRNNPAFANELITWPGWETTAERLRTPYLEAAVGIDNILRCLRVDYVWRLNHTDNLLSGASRHGLRIAFHATF